MIDPVCNAAAAGAHEELVPCDLADRQAVDVLVAGCEAVAHQGGAFTAQGPFGD